MNDRKIWIVCLLLMVFLLFPITANAWKIRVKWDANTESDLGGYNVYFASSYNNIVQLNGNLNKFSTTKICYCYEVDSSVKVVFVAVTAYNTSGESGSSNIVYWLNGDIYGTLYNGVPYTEVRVDGLDLTTLGVYFGQSVTHSSGMNCDDCSGGNSSPSLIQLTDFNKDSRIDGFDLIELGLRFGNTAN